MLCEDQLVRVECLELKWAPVGYCRVCAGVDHLFTNSCFSYTRPSFLQTSPLSLSSLPLCSLPPPSLLSLLPPAFSLSQPLPLYVSKSANAAGFESRRSATEIRSFLQPGPSDSYVAGGDCTIAWTLDTAAKPWTTMNIRKLATTAFKT